MRVLNTVMPVIPNNLHFIWVGKTIPERYADNIVDWALLNPHYKVFLWTQNHLFDQTKALVESVYEKKLAPKLLPPYRYLDRFHGLTLLFEAEEPFSLELCRIETLHQLVNTAFVGEELTTWENYGATSDILRFTVIYEMGGIYMDTDTYSGGKKLPPNIEAPHGLLFHWKIRDGREKIANCVLASVRDCALIRDIAERFEDNYSPEYRELAEGIYEFTDYAKFRLYYVNNSKRVLKSDLPPDDPKREEAEAHYEAFFVKETTDRFKGLACGIVPDMDLVAFQKQSGYYPIIKSDGTWRPLDKER